jgi:hypothetical protein
MTTRRSFSPEFKLEAVRAAERSGNTAQTARDLGVSGIVVDPDGTSTVGSANSATTDTAPYRATAPRATRNSPGSSGRTGCSNRRTRS